MSNVTITLGVKGRKKMPWTRLDVEGTSSGVTPPPCDPLNVQRYGNDISEYDFPEERPPIDDVVLKQFSFMIN